MTPQASCKLPHLPAELSLDILDQAKLNPLELMALVTAGAEADAPHSLQQLASLNRYWSRFTAARNRTENAAEGAYARAFITRYQAMTPQARTLLSELWAGKTHVNDLIQYAGEAFRADPDIMMAAVCLDGWALEHAPEALRADLGVVVAAVSQDGKALVHATKALRADPSVVMAAVSQDGRVLVHASEALRADPGIVMAAVSQEGKALRFASEALRADRDIVKAAVIQNGDALVHAAPSIGVDPELIRIAAEHEFMP